MGVVEEARILAGRISYAVDGMRTHYIGAWSDKYIDVAKAGHKVDGKVTCHIGIIDTDDKLMKLVCRDADKNSVVIQACVNHIEGKTFADVRNWYMRFGFTGLRIMTRRPIVKEVTE